MDWKRKAAIMRLFAMIPNGQRLYEFAQIQIGRLNGSPHSRINAGLAIIKMLHDEGLSLKEKTLFEVGTGHVPVLPILLFLAGSKKVITVDLNIMMHYELLKDCLNQLSNMQDLLLDSYIGLIDESFFLQRFKLLKETKNSPKEFLSLANIEYIAPCDASKTNLENESIDIHFSCTTFEHIPLDILEDIMSEAHRILRKDGISLHIIDPSDHFQHQDSSISKINFLKYSKTDWAKIADNQFAYCSRARLPEYLELFGKCKFDLLKVIKRIDDESLKLLEDGFVIDQEFTKFENIDICTTGFDVVLRKEN